MANEFVVRNGLRVPSIPNGCYLSSVNGTIVGCTVPSPIIVPGTGNCSTLRTGINSTASGEYSVVLGRCSNADGRQSVVLAYQSCIGGDNLIAGGCFSGILSGGGNNISSGTLTNLAYCSAFSVIGGGFANTIGNGQQHSTISGGYFNFMFGSNTQQLGSSTIGGGQANSITACQATIAGGLGNQIDGSFTTPTANEACWSAIGGGLFNYIERCYATIAGGGCNSICANAGAIGGGFCNVITSAGLTGAINGGRNSTISGRYTSIGGGRSHTVSALYATVSGGANQTASGQSSAIGGGRSNTSSATYTVVAGGRLNTASALYASVVGGRANTASGDSSAIVGGRSNTTSGCACAMIVGSNIIADRVCATFVNNLSIKDIPTSSVGLPVGSVWNDAGTLKIV